MPISQSTGTDSSVVDSSGVETPTISLLPLNAADHAAALQAVYRATPGYWEMYHLPGSPAGQAARDLEAAASTPGRTLMGIVRPGVDSDVDDQAAQVEMVGMVDFRLHWPDPNVVYLGMIMVGEAYQNQGIGRAAWQLLAPWLAASAQMTTARAGIEQFNPGALQFLQRLGFSLTGDSSRVQSGKRWVRLLYMEYDLADLANCEPKAAT
jgi:RimJ/RimL family protein N-acetyltransferase